MELDEKVTILENDLAIIKTTIKDVLVALKEDMRRSQSSGRSEALGPANGERSTRDRGVLVADPIPGRVR